MLRGEVFQCDDKYLNYVEELLARGWTRDGSDSSAPVPASCNFICKNLAKLKFATVFDRHVNHMRGSQHLSNKAFLAYHLQAAGCGDVQPPTWTSAVGEVSHLLELLAAHEVVAVANRLLEAATKAELAVAAKECVSRMSVLQAVCTGLSRDNKGARKAGTSVLTNVVSSIHSAIGGAVEEPQRVVLYELKRLCCSEWQCDPSSRDNVWLVKAVGLSCGESIYIRSGILDLLRLISSDMKFKCVVQKYIERPLLVRSGRKFDIRQWVLVTSVNPLVIYGFTQCYLRLSSQPYTLEEGGLTNNFVHLTNNAIQKTAIPDDESSCPDSHPLYHPLMMTQSEFEAALDGQLYEGVSCEGPTLVEDIRSRMKEITAASITATRDRLEKVGRGYEWLGLDFMVSSNLDVKLLEINTSPDTTYSTPITEWLVKAATKDLMDLILEEKLTTVAEIKKSGGARDSTRFATEPSSPRWELWHCGAPETKAQLQSFASRKTDALNVLNQGHRPKGEEYISYVVDEIGDENAVIAEKVMEEDKEDDEL